MAHFLLLGAGFSRNWGGWLSSEAFEYLLGRPEVADSAELRRCLWENQATGGFENALESLRMWAVRGDSAATANLERLRTAVIAMFNEMNEGFDRILKWEFSNDQRSQIATFLTNFDAIFTLNQDLMIERHYLSNSPELRRPDRWSGAAMPGVACIGADTASSVGKRWRILGDDSFRIEPRIQPYIKLHGSTNWESPDGNGVLIIGGNKTDAIGGSPILKWYHSEFERALCAGDARLMVIGYGFRDKHINDLLIRAVNERGLRLFIVSPEGADLARQVNPSFRAAIPSRSDLEAAFERGLVGASRRQLGEIFGGDSLELGKLEQFVSRGE